jgi:hypothetical protein
VLIRGRILRIYTDGPKLNSDIINLGSIMYNCWCRQWDLKVEIFEKRRGEERRYNG